MQMEYNYKALVVVSLVSLSEECEWAQGWRREALEEAEPSRDPLPSDTVLYRQGSGLLDPISVSMVDAYPKNQSAILQHLWETS